MLHTVTLKLQCGKRQLTQPLQMFVLLQHVWRENQHAVQIKQKKLTLLVTEGQLHQRLSG